MLKPDGYVAQEIKATNTKAKIMDMVAIRHSVSSTEKTTLILLCEDGSLRIYSANFATTNFWLSPEIQPIGNYYNSGIVFGGGKDSGQGKRKSKKVLAKTSSKGALNGAAGSASTTFPVDFFEHCSVMPEVEFGGNDLLQIYNTAQLKNRLNSTGLYVVSTRTTGFTMEITNNDANFVMAGFRVLLGTQDPLKGPSCVSILGRKVPTVTTRPRWFDIPLTREESLRSDKKLSLHFGASQDHPDMVTMVDSIKIYGKTKEVFGWPDDISEDLATSPSSVTATTSSNGQKLESVAACNFDSDPSSMYTISSLDKMITSMLDVLDSGLFLLGGPAVDSHLKQQAIDVATSLILIPTPGIVQQFARQVLATLHPNKNQYHLYKDKEVLHDINNELKLMLSTIEYKNIDPEAFYRAVLVLRSIAVQRPQQITKICQVSSLSLSFESFIN